MSQQEHKGSQDAQQQQQPIVPLALLKQRLCGPRQTRPTTAAATTAATDNHNNPLPRLISSTMVAPSQGAAARLSNKLNSAQTQISDLRKLEESATKKKSLTDSISHSRSLRTSLKSQQLLIGRLQHERDRNPEAHTFEDAQKLRLLEEKIDQFKTEYEQNRRQCLNRTISAPSAADRHQLIQRTAVELLEQRAAPAFPISSTSSRPTVVTERTEETCPTSLAPTSSNAEEKVRVQVTDDKPPTGRRYHSLKSIQGVAPPQTPRQASIASLKNIQAKIEQQAENQVRARVQRQDHVRTLLADTGATRFQAEIEEFRRKMEMKNGGGKQLPRSTTLEEPSPPEVLSQNYHAPRTPFENFKEYLIHDKEWSREQAQRKAVSAWEKLSMAEKREFVIYHPSP